MPVQLEQRRDVDRERGVEEGAGREVDRDAELVALLAATRGTWRMRGAEHPAGERDDQAGLLGDRDELLGHEQAVARVVPAHERLDADDAAGHEVDLGLVVQRELARSRARGAARRRARGGAGSSGPAAARRARTPRPASLAEYMAMSARWSSTSTWSPCSGWQAMPIEPPISSVSPSTTNGSRSARLERSRRRPGRRRRRARRAAARRTRRRRGGRRCRRCAACVLRRSATSCSSTSPRWWPSVSLTSLKWSRSMIITAAPPWRRSAARTACWTRSRNSTRFGRPVSASWSDWCSLAIAWRPPRWIASSGRNSSGSTASEKSAAMTSTGERPSSRPAVEAWRKRSEAR